MNTQEQKQLSESLLAACKAAGIYKPKYIAQDLDGSVWHYPIMPYTYDTLDIGIFAYNASGCSGEASRLIHPPYATDWQDSLLEWVEPTDEPLKLEIGKRYVLRNGDITEFMQYDNRDIFHAHRAIVNDKVNYWRPNGQWSNTGKETQYDIVSEYKSQGEPLANALARHPESGKWCVTIETERDNNGEPIAYMIRDHKGDIVQMIRRPDHIADTSKMINACDIAYRKRLSDDTMPSSNANIYRQAWSDALVWWDGNDQPSGIEALVCEDIAKRQQVGIAKYGTTLADNPLSHLEWLNHAYEECLDMAVYLKRAMTEKGEENL